MFEYKLLPVPAPAKKARGRKTVSDRFTHAFSEMLNEQAKDGWEFFGQETFPLIEKIGIMGKENPIKLCSLIFRRKVQVDEVPLDEKLEKLREKKGETMVQALPPMPGSFPEPMPSPQALNASMVANGEEPTRVFAPISTDSEASDAPTIGPAEK
ncbi:MAG: DUF4177 domain-containing protein [Rhodobacteraceae bacterium]|nr:DUF4177 domain-containing protein [Paracoccaceae bacterium]